MPEEMEQKQKARETSQRGIRWKGMTDGLIWGVRFALPMAKVWKDANKQGKGGGRT